jgi:cysteine desulfurase
MSRIYLDDAGAAPLLPEVAEALRHVPAGNPSSPHSEGRAARAALDRARDLAAHALGIERTEVTFVSSGTEAVNLGLAGAARRLQKRGVIATWAAEHQSVLAVIRKLQEEGFAVEIAPVDAGGRADPDSIPTNAVLVSIGLANNEVGTIQPVADVIERAHYLGALVHIDACAGPRWIPIPAGADLVSISGFKLGAGHGGLLLVKEGVKLEPLFLGGPQEWGRRAGREDVAGAVALATALVICKRERENRSSVAAAQSRALRQALVEVGATLTGADRRLPNFASCTFSGRKGEDLLLTLDLAGVAASSGAACASGSLDPSHVLLASGMSLDQALGSLRLTTGYPTTGDEIEHACAIIRNELVHRRSDA